MPLVYKARVQCGLEMPSLATPMARLRGVVDELAGPPKAALVGKNQSPEAKRPGNGGMTAGI
jgi:hypothetical protein